MSNSGGRESMQAVGAGVRVEFMACLEPWTSRDAVKSMSCLGGMVINSLSVSHHQDHHHQRGCKAVTPRIDAPRMECIASFGGARSPPSS